MKKQTVWGIAIVAILAVAGGSVFAYQQNQHQQEKTAAKQKKEEMAEKQASVQDEKKAEASQRAQIVTMPSEPTKPADNIERGWTEESAALFVTKTGQANKHRDDFPSLKVMSSEYLQNAAQFKAYFVKPYWVVPLQSNEKAHQVFLKNNGNHTVTMVLTEDNNAVPTHQYTIDTNTYQVITDKKIDVASSITTWNGF